MKKLLSVLLLSCAMPAYAQKSEINFCVGSKGFPYARAAEVINQKLLSGSVLKLNIINTGGSLESLNKLDDGSCDATIAQPDAWSQLRETSPSKSNGIILVSTLHKEYFHVVCNLKSKITKLSDLNKSHTISLGKDGGGAWVTWQNLARSYPSLNEVKMNNLGGIDGVNAAANEDVTCAAVAAGKPNDTIAEASSLYGDKLAIIEVKHSSFDYAKKPNGDKLYSFSNVNDLEKAYSKLFSPYWQKTITTVSWEAHVFANRKVVNGELLTSLTRAVAQSRQQIINDNGGM